MMKIDGNFLDQGIYMFAYFSPLPLVIFTNGVEPSQIFSDDQIKKMLMHQCSIITEQISSCEGTGKDEKGCQPVKVHLKSGDVIHVASLFYRCPFKQSEIVFQVPDLNFNSKGAIKVTGLGKTNNKYVFAAGDCSETGSILPMAMGNGALAGGLGCSNDLATEEWEEKESPVTPSQYVLHVTDPSRGGVKLASFRATAAAGKESLTGRD